MTRKLHFVMAFVLLLKINMVLYMPFKSFNKRCKNVGPKSFCLAKPTCFDFSSPNFNLKDHILNIVGDDLRNQFHKGQHNLIKFWKKIKNKNKNWKEVFFFFFLKFQQKYFFHLFFMFFFQKKKIFFFLKM